MGSTRTLPTTTRLSRKERLQVAAAAALDAVTVSEYIKRIVVAAARDRLARELKAED